MQELSREFVAVAENQYRLKSPSPESHYFRQVVEQGHYGGTFFHTRQGIYVCTPDGRLLGSIVGANAIEVRSLLQAALAEWGERAQAARTPPVADLEGVTWEDSCPLDGLVLEVVARDLPCGAVPVPSDEALSPQGVGRNALRGQVEARRANHDRVWFSRDEAAQWVPPSHEVGAVHEIPHQITERLARYHFVDSVGGQLPRRFSREEVAGSLLSSEIVERRGDVIRLVIRGETHARSRHRLHPVSARRIDTTVLGEASFHVKTREFTRFELVALGIRADFREMMRNKLSPPRGIGFALRIAPSELPTLAPHFVHRYDADWLSPPAHWKRGRQEESDSSKEPKRPKLRDNAPFSIAEAPSSAKTPRRVP